MPYVARRSYKVRWQGPERGHGPAWPEPLVPNAGRVLAEAVVEHAVNVDILHPKRTVPVFRWLETVLPEDGPLARHRVLPRAIAQVERVLQGEATLPGEMSRNEKKYNGRKLSPHHRAVLASLIREHRDGPPAPALVSVLDLE